MTRKLPAFIFCLFLIQPFLDVLSFFCQGSLLTLGIRLGLFATIVLTCFLLCRTRPFFWILAGGSLVLSLGHLWAIRDFGIQNLASDLTNLIRVLQLPWAAGMLLACQQENADCRHAICAGMTVSLFLSMTVLLLANLTGTEPHTYEDGSGYLGWFSNTNSQSAILCMTVPVAVWWLSEKYGVSHVCFWIGTIGGFAALYLLGTRLAMLGLAATGMGLGLAFLLHHPKETFGAVSLLVVTTLFLCLIPFSPMAQHQKRYASVQADRQAGIDRALSTYDLPSLEEPGLSEAELADRQRLWVEALTPVYTLYAPDFVEYFGAERTIALCNYSAVIGDITETRPKKLKFAQLLLEDSPKSAWLFGMELQRFQVDENNYDVENDFHGIFYLYGIAGLMGLLACLLFFLAPGIGRFFSSPFPFLTPERTAWSIALGTCLLHACFTAGVLRRPNASFYLAACLSCFHEISQTKRRQN